jgi:hypothetical protein
VTVVLKFLYIHVENNIKIQQIMKSEVFLFSMSSVGRKVLNFVIVVTGNLKLFLAGISSAVITNLLGCYGGSLYDGFL